MIRIDQLKDLIQGALKSPEGQNEDFDAGFKSALDWILGMIDHD